MSRRKDQGRLGFWNLELFNIAMLTKPAWNLLVKHNSLCAKALKCLYSHTVKFVMLDAPLLDRGNGKVFIKG